MTYLRVIFSDAKLRRAWLQQIVRPGVKDAAADGADAAWNEFYGDCDKTIRRIAARHCLRRSDWDDFVQDAWLAVLGALAKGRFDPRRGRFQDWLFIVLRNCAVTFFRGQCRIENDSVDLALDLLACPTTEQPNQTLDRVCDIEAVRAALKVLERRTSSTAYAVFHMRQLQDASIADVAVRLGLSRGQVRAYDHRVRRKLADILTRRGFG